MSARASRVLPAAGLALAALLAAGCASRPPQPPDGLGEVRRLSADEIARIEASRPGPAQPLAIDQVVRHAKAGMPRDELLELVRRTHSRHAVTPSEALRLRAEGVPVEVLDELAAEQQRFDQDEAAAREAKRNAQQAAALERARREAEAARHRYYDPWPIGVYPYGSYRFGRPFGHPFYGPPVHRGPNWGAGIRFGW